MNERICADCGRSFVLNDIEIQNFEDKGLSLPKRCQQCLIRNNGEKDINVYYDTTVLKNKPSKPNKDSLQQKINVDKKYNWVAIILTSTLFIVSLVLTYFVGLYEPYCAIFTISTNIILFVLMCVSFIPKKVIKRDSNYIYNSVVDNSEKVRVNRKVTLDTRKYEYKFGSNKKLLDHFEKHGKELFCRNIKEYLDKANSFINRKGILKKTNFETGETILFSNRSMEFAKISKEGHIETYFKANKEYFDRQ